jgi:hypothetical protein
VSSQFLRRSIRRFIFVIIKSFPVIFLFIVNLMIFALIARALFYGGLG